MVQIFRRGSHWQDNIHLENVAYIHHLKEVVLRYGLIMFFAIMLLHEMIMFCKGASKYLGGWGLG